MGQKRTHDPQPRSGVVTSVTATRQARRYLLLIEALLLRTEEQKPMTRTAKLYSVLLSALLLAAPAYATLAQAAQIVA